MFRKPKSKKIKNTFGIFSRISGFFEPSKNSSDSDWLVSKKEKDLEKNGFSISKIHAEKFGKGGLVESQKIKKHKKLISFYNLSFKNDQKRAIKQGALVLTVVLIIFGAIFSTFKQNNLYAANGNWTQTTFDGSSDGTYTNTTSANGNADVALTSSAPSLSNAGGGTWQYKRANTVNNSGSELTNYQTGLSTDMPNYPVNYDTNDSSLKGLWHMSEGGSSATTADSSGNSNTGTLTIGGSGTQTTATQAWTNGASGKIGQALNFDGTDDYVSVANSSTLSPGTGNFTVGVWFKTSKNYSGGRGDIYADYGTTTNNTVLVSIDTDNKPWIMYRDGSANVAQVTASGSAVNDNLWHYITAVRDGTTARYYLDGIQINTNTNASLGNINTGDGNNAAWARNGHNNASYFSGLLDEPRVYNRALSAQEIKDHANMVYGLNAGLAGSWHMGEAAGTISGTVADSSGNSNNGTLTNIASPSGIVSGGKFGNGMTFGGGNDHINISSTSVGNFPNGSISAWVYPTSLTGNSGCNSHNGSTYCQTIAFADDYGYFFGINSDGALVLDLGNDSSWVVVNSTVAGLVTANSWQHVMVTLEGTTVKYYTNGTLRQTNTVATNSGFNLTANNRLGIGGSALGNYSFTGTMDEFKLYSRVLSTSEVTELASSTPKLRPDMQDLRYADSTGATEYAYWLESDKKAWVKVPTLATGDNTVNMYYGNTSATFDTNCTDSQNGDKANCGASTFEFFDDFTGSTIDTAKWTETDTGSNYITQNNTLNFSGGSGSWGAVGMKSVSNFSRSFVYELDHKRTGGQFAMQGLKDTDAAVSYTNLVYGGYPHYPPSPTLRVYEDSVDRGSFTPVPGNGVWESLRFEVLSTGAKYYISPQGRDGYSLYYNSSYSTESPLKLGIAQYDQIFEIDNARVRKLASTEPTSQPAGSESSLGYNSSGSYTSAEIQPSGLYGDWGTLTYTETENAGTTLTIDVLNGSSGATIQTNVSSGTNLALSTTTYPTLKLKANLACTTCTNTSLLHSWDVAYTYDTTGPTGTALSWGTVGSTTMVVTGSGATDTESGLRGDNLTYYIERDNNATSFTTADANSGWISGTWSQLSLTANTAYAYRVKSRDTLGNESGWVTPTPAYKYTLTNTPVLDTYASATNDTTPQITNSASPHASLASRTIKLYDNGTLKATTTANGSGVFTFANGDYSSAFTEGAHTNITARALNADSVESADSNALNITVDITPPIAPSAATIVSGSGWNTNYIADANKTAVKVSGTKSTDTTQIQIELDDEDTFTTPKTTTLSSLGAGTSYADATGIDVTTVTALTDTTIAYRITASDAAGNTSAQTVLKAATTFNKDIVLPNPPSAPDLAAADDSGSSSTDNITKNTSALTMGGTADVGITVEIFDDATSKGTGTATGGSYSIDITLTEGVKSITAKAVDTAGNYSAASGALSVTVDASAPSAPSAPDLAVGDDTGSSNSDNITKNTTGLTMAGTAEANSTVEIFDGVTSKGTGTATGGNYSIDISLSDGSHSVTAKATDTAGNISNASTGLTVNIDSAAASTGYTTVPISPDGTNSYFKTNPLITLSVTDPAPSGGNGTTYYKWDDATLTSPSTYSGAIDMNATIGQGVHTLYFRTVDTAGNEETIKSQEFKLDTTAPTVTNVTSNSANGTYVLTNTIDVRVTYTEAVVVTGTPQVTLETGTLDRTADYSSGTGTNTLVFTYTVQDGDTATDLDYVVTNPLGLNGGTIKDATAGNDSTNTLPSPGGAGSLGGNKAIAIDGVVPTITSITSTSLNGSYGLGQAINVTLNFSENVTLANGGTLTVTLETGSIDRTASISPFSNSNTASGLYVVQSGDASLDLTASSISLSGTTLRDQAGNNANLSIPVGQNLADNKDISLDTVAPTVSNVTSNTVNGTYVAGNIIDIRVTFSEAVTVTGIPRITLNTTPNRSINYSSGSGTPTLVFNYTVQPGDTATDLDYVSQSALFLNGGTIKDTSTNTADLTLPEPGAVGSLGANKNIAVDTTQPSVLNVTSNTANGSYKAGSVIDVRVVFSESVNVTGTPQITLETGNTDRIVNYASGSGSNTLVFNYTIQAGDTSSDLDYVATTSLSLNAGTIKDVDANNNAILTLASPGASGSLGSNKNIIIDTTVPTVTNITSNTANGSYNADDVIDIRVTFSESVNVTGTPQITLETGNTDRVVNYASGSGSNTLVFNYTVQSGDTSTDLDYVGTTSLALNLGGIKDTALNDATLTLPSPGASGSLGLNKAIVIDTTAPSISSVTSTTNNGSYKAGNTVNVTVNFSENVTLNYGGTLTVTLETGITDRTVTITPFSNTNTASGTYTVQSGDESGDLAAQSPLVVSGTLTDGAGNTIVLTIPNGQNISDAKAIVIDTTAPTTSYSTSPASIDGDNSYFKTNPTITLSVSDPSPSSGNGTTYYKWNDAGFTSPSTYSSGINMNNSVGQGTHTLYWRTIDSVGNTETLRSQEFKLDSVSPTSLSVAIAGGDNYGTLNPATLTLSASDATAGVASMQFSNDGITYSTWETYGVSKVWDLTDATYGGTSGDGSKTVYVKFKDNAGNVTSEVSDSITLDTVKPTNPNSPATGEASASDSTALTSGNWYNYTTPKFTLSGASDLTSGVAGYYIYWGSSTTADPAVSGSYQASNIYNPTLLSNDSGKTYYLRVRAKDNAGNTYLIADTSTYTLFTYKFDITNPTGVSYITADPSGYSVANSFDFTWPVSTDPEVNGDASEVSGYEYKKQIDETWTSSVANSITGITAYQNGVNVLQVRVKDNAGNYSDFVPVNYYYSGNIPAPTNLQADISQSQNQTVNNFKFTWTAPGGVTPQGYYYSVNAAPTTQNSTFIETTSTDYDAFATQQGLNTFYVVTKDENGNVGWSSYAQVNFTCNTSAPGSPTSILISDSSNRDTERWQLTVNWDPPTTVTNDFSGYVVERSTDGEDWTQIATTSSQTTGYLDTNLSNETEYYYRIRARDNTGNLSATSTEVQKVPTGKYTSPPNLIGTVGHDVKATKGEVEWTTDREADSFVQIGTTTDYGMTQGQLESTKTHKVELSGLVPGTTYHFRAMWRDSDGNIGYSSDQIFRTSDAPAISEVKVTDIRLDSAVVTWKTNTISTSTVYYGKTSSYGSSVVDTSGSNTTVHTVKLTSLEDGTIYNFKIGGTDVDGNAISSDNYIFSTLPRPRISNVKYEQVKNMPVPTFKIDWETNVPTSSEAVFTEVGKTATKENAKATLETAHSLTITNLKDSTEYDMIVKGRDEFGNEAVSTATRIKTSVDARAPQISNITVEVSTIGYGIDAKGQLVVSWETDEMATSQVIYGMGVSGAEYSSRTQEDESLTTQHIVIISDLKPSTSYHFNVISKDKAGNESKGTDTAVLTEQATESVVDVVINSLQTSIGWIFGIFFGKN